MYLLSAIMNRVQNMCIIGDLHGDRADIKTAAAWNQYMADFAQKVRNPLTVKVN